MAGNEPEYPYDIKDVRNPSWSQAAEGRLSQNGYGNILYIYTLAVAILKILLMELFWPHLGCVGVLQEAYIASVLLTEET